MFAKGPACVLCGCQPAQYGAARLPWRQPPGDLSESDEPDCPAEGTACAVWEGGDGTAHLVGGDGTAHLVGGDGTAHLVGGSLACPDLFLPTILYADVMEGRNRVWSHETRVGTTHPSAQLRDAGSSPV